MVRYSLTIGDLDGVVALRIERNDSSSYLS